MTDAVENTETLPEAPASDPHYMAKMRIQIDDLETRLVEARGNIAGADAHLEKLELELHRWKRWRAYQVRRETGLKERIRIERETLRMEEDYASAI
jgi:hypothetical protein